MNQKVTLSERDTIEQAKAGDESAFEQLLDAQYERIYRFAYKWCGSVSDAEDITQQACIKLARNLGQFRFESSFSSWLYRLVINCAKDWYKSQKRHRGDSIDADAEVLQVADIPRKELEEAEGIAYLDQVFRCLDDMADGFKETAIMVFAEGFTHKEVADVLGLKESTVSWRIHEIRKQLQALLQEGLL